MTRIGAMTGLAAAIALSAPPVPALAQRPMSPVDLLSVPALSDPQISPRGDQVLFVRSEADWQRDREVAHVWRVSASGGDPAQLTNGDRGESAPRWSPDAETIAFVAQRDEDQHQQIYLLPSTGGEARVLTHHPTAVSDLAWSPDGSALYFIASDEPSTETKKRDVESGKIYALDENFEQRHLWRVDVANGQASRVTEGAFSVTAFDVSRDGRRIALHRAPTPLVNSLDAADIWVTDTDGRNPARITENRVAERGVRLSPDQERVLFLAGANERFEPYYTTRVFLAPSTGGAVRLLLADLPYEVMSADWSADGASIFFAANMGVHSELFRLEIASGQLQQLTDGEHAIVAWTFAPGPRIHVLQLTDASNPGDLWRLEAGGTVPHRLTRVFDHLTREFRLPRQERIEWRGQDGARVEGILDYPTDYEPGRRYPLVVQTHGGPQSSDRFGWGYWLNYTQVLTGMGYAVFKPNYRGSTGYGDEFVRDMVGHYFHNSHLDVMAGVDHLVSTGIADPDRMVKMGWSAGGHMTNKVITITDRFKAAASGAGGANFLSFYGQSDIRLSSYRDQWFGGSPWDKDVSVDVVWSTSPLRDAWKVTTPTIFQVGEQDMRVPASQSVEMFRALRYHGVDTHLYLAPGEPHVYRQLRHRLFKINVELEWFERHARARAYDWARPRAKPVPRTASTRPRDSRPDLPRARRNRCAS